MRPTLALALLALLAMSAACRAPRDEAEVVAAGGPAGRYGLGRPATPDEVAAISIAVDPEGAALPEGKGSVARGAVLFREKCASCHGPKGEGVPPLYPKLVGREPRDGFPFGRDAKIERTIGNYWPYATTLFDYVRRAMPLTAPRTLSNDDVYALTAWLLSANDIVPKTAVLDAESLRRVRMPARDRFVRDDRRGGAEVR